MAILAANENITLAEEKKNYQTYPAASKQQHCSHEGYREFIVFSAINSNSLIVILQISLPIVSSKINLIKLMFENEVNS